MREEVDFSHAENLNVFSKLVLLFLMGVVKHTQIANQIKEFLEEQYLKKDSTDCLGSLHG